MNTNRTNTAPIGHARGPVSALIRRLPVLVCFSLAITTRATVSTSDLPGLGALGNFDEIGKQLVEMPGPATNSTFSIMTVVDGTLFSDPNVSSEQSEVLALSSALAELIPDQTINGDQSTGLSFNVNPGQAEVVDLNGGLNLDNQDITLAGGGSLVLNIKDSFSLDGSVAILGNPFNIYINYEGSSTIQSDLTDAIDGLVFDPVAPAHLDGSWNGGVYALLSGDPVNPAPEPRELILSGFAGLALHLARRRLTAKK